MTLNITVSILDDEFKPAGFSEVQHKGIRITKETVMFFAEAVARSAAANLRSEAEPSTVVMTGTLT